MLRPVYAVVLSLALAAPSLFAQNGDAIQRYFTGKDVVLKIDMPGSQKGVDLRLDKETPMNWKDYGSRLKQYGTAIRKGDTAKVTSIVVKNDRIEFQLDGGGFGTFLDDSSTTVTPVSVDKSDYEKDLERQISNTTDDDLRRKLQRDLDRERARRERQEDANKRAAQVASQIKSQQVADSRMRGGSRFNLRWSGSIPANELTPEGVMRALAEYVDFPAAAPPAQPVETAGPPPPADAAEPQIQRGMDINHVAGLLGQGRQISESVSNDGLKTQILEYSAGERHFRVTYVDGLVVRYTINSQ